MVDPHHVATGLLAKQVQKGCGRELDSKSFQTAIGWLY